MEMNFPNTLRLCGSLLLVLSTTVGTAAPGDAADLQALRAQIQALETQLRELSRQLREHEAAAAAKPSVPPAATVTANADGFSIAAAEGNYRFRIWGNVQGDARGFFGDRTRGNDTFLLRRLPLNVEGTVADRFAFRIMPDFASSDVNLLEAHASYRHGEAFNVLLGKTKSPFDLERLVAQTNLLFIERAHPTSLAPNRDVGVQVFGELARRTLSYQLALLNGARDYDSTSADLDDAKDVVVRIFAHPFRNRDGSFWRGLGIGLAASDGERNAGAPNGIRTPAQQPFVVWRNGVENRGRHSRIEPQAYYYRGPLGAIGSWVASRQHLSPASGLPGRQITNSAWYAALNWVVSGEDASYRGVEPRQSFSWAEGTWGAWEVAARYSELALDDEVFPELVDPATSAQRARSSALGFNWYLNRNVKASLNFEYTSFVPAPTLLPARAAERALLSRFQLRY